MVPGEQISANTKCSSSQAAVVPLGERLGVPSGQTVAMKPNCCSSTMRRMSSVRMPIELLSSLCPAGPYVERGPHPRGIVQRAAPDADYAIPRHTANPGAALGANESGVYAPAIGSALKSTWLKPGQAESVLGDI